MEENTQTKAAPVEPIERGFTGHFFYGLGMLLTHLFTRYEKRGLENIPAEGPFIIAANHETYVDGMWIGSLLPHKHFEKFCALVGADLMTDHGPFGKIICHVGRGIPVDRKANPVRGIILAKKQVDKGYILLVHPEGTRCHDGKLGPLQDGAAYIAKKAEVPVLPVYVDGGFELFNRHWKWPKPFLPGRLRRKRLILKVGKPLRQEDYADAKELTAALEKWFLEQQATREVHERQAFTPEIEAKIQAHLEELKEAQRQEELEREKRAAEKAERLKKKAAERAAKAAAETAEAAAVKPENSEN